MIAHIRNATCYLYLLPVALAKLLVTIANIENLKPSISDTFRACSDKGMSAMSPSALLGRSFCHST